MKRFLSFCSAIALVGYSAVSQAAPATCDIFFHIGTSTPLTAVSVDIGYAEASGEFVGMTHFVDCELINTTAPVSKYDFDATRVLRFQAILFSGTLNGPKDFMKCTWVTTSSFPVSEDFPVLSEFAQDEGNDDVSPEITVSKIECSLDPTTTTVTTTSTTVSTTTTTSTTTSTTLPDQLCGDFDGNEQIQTSDALRVLRASVGSGECQLCVCDVDSNGITSATDALFVLRYAVDLPVELDCPTCA